MVCLVRTTDNAMLSVICFTCKASKRVQPRRDNKRGDPLLLEAKHGTALVALTCVALLLMTVSTLAITAEVAKKCGVLTDMAYPLRVLGNPAAGRANGTAQAVRDYFSKCVAKEGKMQQPTAGVKNHDNSRTPEESR